jgi:transcription elongation factor GreA
MNARGTHDETTVELVRSNPLSVSSFWHSSLIRFSDFDIRHFWILLAKQLPLNRLASRSPMSEPIPMTRAGYDKIRAELKDLQHEQMPLIEDRIAKARAEGDLSENAEYHGARESQGMLQAKINLLRDKLARATIVDTSKLVKGEVVFGATVVVKDLDFGDTEEFTLVGAGEEDYDDGKINVISPLAQGLLGRKQGEKVDIEVPAGTNRFEILEIRFEEE